MADFVNTRFVHVARPTGTIGRGCMHCGRPARVVAERVTQDNGRRWRMAVAYCDEHAQQLIEKETT